MVHDVDMGACDRLSTRAVVKACEASDTLMIGNIPCRCNQQEVAAVIDEAGFAGRYQFFYLPMRRNKKQNHGYAFITIVEPPMVEQFVMKMNGFRFTKRRSVKTLYIRPARMQGLEYIIQLFQGTNVADSECPPIFDKNAVTVLRRDARSESDTAVDVQALYFTRDYYEEPESMLCMDTKLRHEPRGYIMDQSISPLQVMGEGSAAGGLPRQLPLVSLPPTMDDDEFLATASEDEQCYSWEQSRGGAALTQRRTVLNHGHLVNRESNAWGNQEALEIIPCAGQENGASDCGELCGLKTSTTNVEAYMPALPHSMHQPLMAVNVPPRQPPREDRFNTFCYCNENGVGVMPSEAHLWMYPCEGAASYQHTLTSDMIRPRM